jgi:hypothetical protein
MDNDIAINEALRRMSTLSVPFSSSPIRSNTIASKKSAVRDVLNFWLFCFVVGLLKTTQCTVCTSLCVQLERAMHVLALVHATQTHIHIIHSERALVHAARTHIHTIVV